MENKNSFFKVVVNLDNPTQINTDKLNDNIDLLLGRVSAKAPLYQFTNGSNREVVFYFQTDSRKRKGQITKLCETILEEDEEFTVMGQTKMVHFTDIERMKQNKNFKEIYKVDSKLFENYKGTDIEIFDNVKNWHPWQKEVYKIIFNEEGKIKKPDSRAIYSIVCKGGNSGKSSFFKWLYVNHPQDIGRVTYGTASQLRSSIINLGPRRIYIIDLARSKGVQESESDLMASVEDIKSGQCFSAMYGRSGVLIMEPPHIIISSNYMLETAGLSLDRWNVFQIHKDSKKLIKVKPSEMKRQLVQQEKETAKENMIKKLRLQKLKKEVKKEYQEKQGRK